MKKNAVGVRGMRLERNDTVIEAYLFNPVSEGEEQPIENYPLFSTKQEEQTIESKISSKWLSSLRLARRDTKGSRIQ